MKTPEKGSVCGAKLCSSPASAVRVHYRVVRHTLHLKDKPLLTSTADPMGWGALHPTALSRGARGLAVQPPPARAFSLYFPLSVPNDGHLGLGALSCTSSCFQQHGNKIARCLQSVCNLLHNIPTCSLRARL